MYERYMAAICKVRLSAGCGISVNTCKLTSGEPDVFGIRSMKL